MATQGKKKDDTPLRRLVAALLLASDGPLNPENVVRLVSEAVDEEEWKKLATLKEVEDALYSLMTVYDESTGLELVQVAGGWRFRTASDLGGMVRRLWPERRVRLSHAALEAVSVIAYRQPCTRLDVEAVRGVDCSGIVRSLLERGLVRIVGKKEEPGRPLLYGTTPLFLETFSLEDLGQLPTLRDLENLEAEEAARAIFEVTGEMPDDDDPLITGQPRAPVPADDEVQPSAELAQEEAGDADEGSASIVDGGHTTPVEDLDGENAD